jgi:hypothetical protein
MNSIKQKLFTNWHLMRIMRLAIGLWMLVVGIQTRDWAVGLFSTFFLYQAITDTGCCGSQACNTPSVRKKEEIVSEIEYEEVK